ncbi:MAG: choice-of-anchor Q domain-containing protein [Verrucomicrobiota bacterium]|jgi:hypothetical protein
MNTHNRPTIHSLNHQLTGWCLALVCAGATTVRAATITVTNTADNGAGTLRAALASVANGDTINFAVSLPATITLTTGELLVTNSVSIIGPGSGNLAVDGNAASRVFHITNAVTASISRLTITNGVTFGYVNPGAGIYNDHSTLTVSNCTISGNTSGYLGGGICNGGDAGSATLTVIASTLSGNSAWAGGGIVNYGCCGGSATLTVSASTLSGNSAGGQGGGICNLGNPFNEDAEGGSATLTVSASTLSGNSAGFGGGGILHEVAAGGSATLTLSASTLSDNSSGGTYYVGAIFIVGYDGIATLEIGDTILNGNASGENILNLYSSPVTSDGYNLSSDAAGGDDHSTGPGGLLNATGDIRNTDPMLGPLADNGGPNFTHALLPGSPAIDQGKSFGLTTDQRGFSRPVDDACIANAAGGDGSDIGAFEVQEVCRPVDFRVTAIKGIGSSDDLRLSYTTVLGSNYVVQARSNLVSGSWSSLSGTNVGIGVVMQTIVTNALAAPQGFYRIQQSP